MLIWLKCLIKILDTSADNFGLKVVLIIYEIYRSYTNLEKFNIFYVKFFAR